MNTRLVACVDESLEQADLYYRTLNDWDNLYPVEHIEDGYQQSTMIIEDNKKYIERLFQRKYLPLNDGKIFLDLDLSQRVMSRNELLGKEMLILLPHNDDICWAYNLFKGQRDAGAKVQTMLFASDCSGISSAYATRYAAEHFTAETYSLEKLKNVLSQQRIHEYEEVVARLGGEVLDLPVPVSSCYEPTKVFSDDRRLYSYVSNYRDFDPANRRVIIDYFASKMTHWATNHCRKEGHEKLCIVVPFAYDNHPAHRMLFKVMLESFLAVPEKYKEYIRFFMYPSLNVLKEYPGSVYYPFGDDGKTEKFYVWRKMDTQLQRNENFYLQAFPKIDHANALQCKPPTNEPYAEKLIELKYRHNNPIPR